MTGQDDDKQVNERFGDLIADLRDLGVEVRSQKYPGRAWSARGRRHIVLWPIAGALAAAAAVLLVVLIAKPWDRRDDGTGGAAPTANVKSVELMEAEYDLLVWEVIAREEDPIRRWLPQLDTMEEPDRQPHTREASNGGST